MASAASAITPTGATATSPLGRRSRAGRGPDALSAAPSPPADSGGSSTPTDVVAAPPLLLAMLRAHLAALTMATPLLAPTVHQPTSTSMASHMNSPCV